MVIAAVIASAISAFFYARIIVLMFFTEPRTDEVSVVIPSNLTSIAIGVSVAITVLLGIVPQPVIDLAQKASIFVR